MRNLLKKRLPERLVRTIADFVRKIRDHIGPYTCTLTADERARTVYLRPGAEGISAVVTSTAEKVGVVLPTKTSDIREDLVLASQLKPLLADLELAATVVRDTIQRAEHEAWSATTAYYTALARLAATDHEIEKAIAPAKAFFALGPRKGTEGEAADAAPIAPAAPPTTPPGQPGS